MFKVEKKWGTYTNMTAGAFVADLNVEIQTVLYEIQIEKKQPYTLLQHYFKHFFSFVILLLTPTLFTRDP